MNMPSIIKHMKPLLILAILALTGCSLNKAFPVGPNPLDVPGSTEPTAAELHAENIAEITGNPTKRPW